MTKPNLHINTNNFFMKHAMFRHTQSGSIDFIQKSWKVGATGLKERSPMPMSHGQQDCEKIHPFHQTLIQPNDIKILKELGSGASSTVHLISYRDQQFALKCINLDDEKHEFKSAQTEISCLRLLQNKYIVHMRQAYIRNRRIAIMLEYMNAASLHDAYTKCNRLTQRCSFGKRSHEQVRGISNMAVLSAITSQILIGLLDMHHQHIVHRDIKPSNLLLHSYNANDGAVKVTDFGLAKLLSKDEMCTEIVGTMKYYAPERLSYQGYDASSDIWSLGITIAETFLGRYPFEKILEQDDEEAFRSFICDNPLKCDDFPAHLFPSDLLKFITSCLEMNPENRPTPEQLLQFAFLKHANTEDNSRQILGKWIEQNKLKLPPVSNPVSIRTTTPRGRRASMVKQFFSISSDGGSPVVPMSFGTPSGSVLSQHFQQMSIGDSLRSGAGYTNMQTLDPELYCGEEHRESHYVEPSSQSPQSPHSLENGSFLPDSSFLPKDDMEMFGGFSFE
mmetsp:Transcript_430/g.1623  ORF Transcript_430/g.1623 Transcript_430/m.1623 type:complete len:504 (-) Transcript_430:73-1584(-)